MSRTITALATTLAALILGAVAPAAHAADRVVSVTTPDGPGPARTDRVRVLQQGPASAKHVLVLVPGTSASASYFRPVAGDILRRLPGWQVWSVARRETALEDQSVLDAASAGTATPQRLFDYYLGWLGDPSITSHFQPVADAAVPYARRWGMKVAIDDLHTVIALARRNGRDVVLGGHSLGGSIAEAYATWDFAGRTGARDLAGLVLIDGAGGGRGGISGKDARARLAALEKASPFSDLTGTGLPWSAGVFNAIGSRLALLAPDAPSLLGAWPLLPPFLRAPVPVTNAAAYGFALDTETGPASLALVQSHLGRLAPAGDPRPWQDGGLAPVARVASVFAGVPGMDGSSWYHPSRLSLDAQAVNGGLPTPAQRLLGVRTIHGSGVRLPIYAFATSLGGQRVLDAARQLARQSRVPARELTLVDRSRTFAHIDPLSASPEKNDFLKTVVPFLKRIR
ncbi:MAG: alpha/beta hydrolase [Solirubrobacterales bacterium]|nr:alpha/beta hydrolase [Solirubrobacterales bacterium]